MRSGNPLAAPGCGRAASEASHPIDHLIHRSSASRGSAIQQLDAAPGLQRTERGPPAKVKSRRSLSRN